MNRRIRTKRKTIVMELDPESIEGVSKAQLENYRSLGCTPYLMDDDSIKWLTAGQSALRHHRRSFRLFKFSLKDKSKAKRRSNRRKLQRINISSFLVHNLPFISIVILVVLIIYLTYNYWYTIF